MLENYIKSIIVGDRNDRRQYGSRKGSQSVLSISYPIYRNQKGCITVICGKNNSGKSHIIKNVIGALKNQPYIRQEDKLVYQGNDIQVEFSNPQAPIPEKILHVNDLTSAKRSYENFRLDKNSADPKGKGPKYKSSLLYFVKSQIEKYLGKIDSESWISDGEYRLDCIRKLEVNKLYLCDQDNLVVSQFQEAVSGALYFQRTEAIKSQPLDIWLYYDPYRIFNYGKWSDGQKTLFTCLLQLDYLKPDILLIDEIENHFHPEYISQLCSAIKETTKQSLLVSHHPHVIFSNLIDQVIYIETIVSSDTYYEECIEIQPSFNPRAPRRRVVELCTDFEKISSVYGLFDQQDHQLLQLACLMDDLIEREFINMLSSFFEAEPDGNQRLSKQSAQLAEIINLSPSLDLRILDFESGRGGIFEGFMQKPSTNVEWHFWEPNKDLHRDLEELLLKYEDVNTKIIESEHKIKTEYYDYVILSNCLHSLTPLDLAKTLAFIQRGLKTKNGKLIILEVYPLISPQKYAVQYDENTLTNLLNSIGWKCESGQLKLPAEYISAYWISAYSPDSKIVFNVLENANEIRRIWHEEIMPRACNRYDGMLAMSSIKSFFKYNSEFKTIMSIVNEERDIWRSTSRTPLIIKDDEVKLSRQIIKDESTRTKILNEIQRYGIDENLFFKLIEIVVRLSQSENEKDIISTSLIIKTDDSGNDYFEKYKSHLRELDATFFDTDNRNLIEEVEQVDGINRAFVILAKNNEYKVFIQTLEGYVFNDVSKNIGSFLDSQWSRIQSLIQDSGCALIINKKSRIKILMQGDLLAEYRSGEWKPRNIGYYKMKIKELAQSLSCSKNDDKFFLSVLLDVFQKCVFAVETDRGLTFAIQLDEEGILKRCDRHYKISKELREKKIMDFSNEDYLNRIAGDGAAILDRDGYTLATNALFQPQPSTDVEPTGKGARRLNAQKITKETQAVAFVVSVNGSIKVFHKGKIVFKVL